MVFSPGVNLLAAGFMADNIKIWSVKTGKLVREFEQEFSESDSVAFSPDGSRVVSGGENQNIQVWDVKSGGLLWRLMPASPR
jgi:WD40 repeat protein